MKIKKVFKNRIFLCLFTALVVGTVSVSATTYFASSDVTYDNKESGLASNDVQGAIDELYNACFPPKPPTAANTIIDLLLSNADKLYEDEHGDIRYYGKNPNNYVSFNNELWRIIGVIDGKVKIIRNESVLNNAWGSSFNNNWNKSTLKSYLNGTYYNSIDGRYKNMISEETYYLGGPTDGNYDSLTASDYYTVERDSTQVYSGNPASTTQKIGLMYPSDYGYAARSSCLSTALYNYDDGCYSSDYLYSGVDEWLQTPFASDYNYAIPLDIHGNVETGYRVAVSNAVRPVLYLTSETQITGGDGSKSNPFQLSL